MAKCQENSTTIILVLKGYQMGEVKEDKEGVLVEVRAIGEEVNCPYCGWRRLYKRGACVLSSVLHGWSNGKKGLSSITSAALAVPGLRSFFLRGCEAVTTLLEDNRTS
jgi:hypothetical protein